MSGLRLSPVAVAAWPLLVTSLVNRSANIALDLLPVLAIERALSPGESSWFIGTVKVCAVLGTLVGGALCDRYGPRATLIGAWLLSSLGTLALALPVPVLLLVASGAAAQLGQAMYPATSRGLLAVLVPPAHQKESVGWLRTANNLGSLGSYALGAAAGRLGLTLLFLLDAAASLAAAAIGARTLPRHAPRVPAATDPTAAPPPGAPADRDASHARAAWGPFIQATALWSALSMAYGGYLTAAAASYRLAHGEHGISLFSGVMVLNTAVCALLGVVAARFLTNPARVMPAGCLALAAGAAVGAIDAHSIGLAFLAMALVTAGEILFTALVSFLVMCLTPPGPRASSTYASAVACTMLARAAGGALVFPLVVYGDHPVVWSAVLSAPAIALSLTGGRIWRAYAARSTL